MRDFGVAEPFAAPLGTLIPVAELAVAAALVFPSTAWSGALGAAVLLLCFVEAIATSIARGIRPGCQCFGRLSPSPAGWGALLRTALLAGIAGFVVVAGLDDVGPGPADLGALGALGAVVVVAVAVLAAQTALTVHLLGDRRRLRARVDELEATSGQPGAGLAVGSAAPDFAMSGLHGERITLGALRAAGKPVLLVFTDPGSGPCSALLPAIARWQREHASALTIALVSRGDEEDNRARSREHGVFNVLLQKDREVARAFEANSTPSAVLVTVDGSVGSSAATGAEGVRALVAQVLDAPAASLIGAARPEGPVVGRRAPEIELEDLDGRPFSLLDLEGRRVFVLFWDPACAYCGQMLGDLAAWAEDPPDGAPELVVVSRGSVESNRAMELSATVLIDPDWSTTRSFGAAGTPMGVLVDEEGRIASQVGAGAPAVFELLSVEAAS
jgi:peroxiredoxin